MTKKKIPVKIEKPKQFCVACEKEHVLDSFYNTNNRMMFPNGKVNICKRKIKEQIDYNDMNTVYDILKKLDVPFLQDYWMKACEKESDSFGSYLRMANALHQFKGLGYENSTFTSKTNQGNTEILTKKDAKVDDNLTVTDDLLEKWGFGYTPDEYKFFEKKYAQLKNNYQEKTAMHREALLTYIRYRVREELATAKGDVRDAKEWGQLAAKAANDAKINPSQMSKSDLSDGLDTFGQLVRTVEQAVDIIPILPQFKERPQDKADFTLWCYVNYVRDLKSLPPAKYKDIYQFYEERRKEYERKELEELQKEQEETDE